MWPRHILQRSADSVSMFTIQNTINDFTRTVDLNISNIKNQAYRNFVKIKTALTSGKLQKKIIKG